MTDTQFDALRAAVTLAKNYRIDTVQHLRTKLRLHGFSPEDIQVALTTWANHIRKSKAV